MIRQTIEELRELKKVMEQDGWGESERYYTLDKAIIACEQLRKARKKAKRWKRKYLELRADVEKNMKLDVLYDRLIAEKGGE